MSWQFKSILTVLVVFICVSVVSFSIELSLGHGKKATGHEGLTTVAHQQLPGVTWNDDIHPIFIKNNCHTCHTRGDEDTVEGLTEFALGLIAPDNPGNSYFSFHELVYTEGVPRKIEGEGLRDGQCCWPYGSSPTQQRRIWLGNPGNSALLRKLERDYYTLNRPPRYLEEGLRLTWGIPMPMWENSSEPTTDKKDASVKKQVHSAMHSPSLINEIKLRFKLLVGRGKSDIATLPPPIPAKDRGLIREWINNAVQLRTDKTTLSIQFLTKSKQGIAGLGIKLFGDVITHEQKDIQDFFELTTNSKGFVTYIFPKDSVVSRNWSIVFEERHDIFDSRKLTIIPDKSNQFVFTL